MFVNLDKFLRLTPGCDAALIVQTRAVAFICLAFVATQCINLVSMTVSYGRFTFDHGIAISVIIASIIGVICLRYFKNFKVYTLVFSITIFASIAAASVPSGLGIHSSLLPLIILGVVANAYIGTWRSNFIFSIISIGFVWLLYARTMTAPFPDTMATEIFTRHSFQRAAQCSLAIAMTSVISACYTNLTHDALRRLTDLAEKVKHSENARNEVLANISHEMRTPLNGILGLSDMMTRGNLPSKEKRLAEIILKNSEEVSGLIDNIVSFSQSESGTMVFNDQPFDIRNMVTEIIDQNKPLADGKDIVFTVHISELVGKEYRGDQFRIQHILNSIFENAIKFTHSGVISIFVSKGQFENQASLIFSIKDTGIGIQRQNLDRIFERFAQVDSSRKREYRGVGLGLATAKNICDLMGGEIYVTSKYAVGSEFTVTIPLEEHFFGNVKAELRIA